MTTDQEREYERYQEDFSHWLRGAARESRDRNRRRRRLMATGAGACTVAVAVAVALTLIPGGSGLGLAAKARAALAPAHQIVHMVITRTGRIKTHGGGSAPFSIVIEHWSSAGAYRSRKLEALPVDGVTPTHPALARASSYNAATRELRVYDPDSDVLRVIDNARSGDSYLVALLTGAPASPKANGDLAAWLYTMLAKGDVRDAGTTDASGRTLRRLIATRRDDRGNVARIVFDVDPDTFAPVDLSFSVTPPPGGATSNPAPLAPVHYHVTTYERIPLTSGTKALLTINPRPTTKVIHQTERN